MSNFHDEHAKLGNDYVMVCNMLGGVSRGVCFDTLCERNRGINIFLKLFFHFMFWKSYISILAIFLSLYRQRDTGLTLFARLYVCPQLLLGKRWMKFQ